MHWLGKTDNVTNRQILAPFVSTQVLSNCGCYKWRNSVRKLGFKTHWISVHLCICYAAYDNVQVILSLCTELRYTGSGGRAPLILNIDIDWK